MFLTLLYIDQCGSRFSMNSVFSLNISIDKAKKESSNKKKHKYICVYKLVILYYIIYKLLWKACNLTAFIPSLTGPVPKVSETLGLIVT